MNYENEIREATYPDIRLFKVKKETSLTPKEDLSPTQGEWQECTPQSVNSFSAVGYFFARQLQQKLKTPIGVIDCSWGGTPAEAWTSYNGLKHLQEFEHEMDMLESLGFQPERLMQSMPRREKHGINLCMSMIWDGVMTIKYGLNLIIQTRIGKK